LTGVAITRDMPVPPMLILGPAVFEQLESRNIDKTSKNIMLLFFIILLHSLNSITFASGNAGQRAASQIQGNYKDCPDLELLTA
jgi:hypothetical protein